jgi:hypothetical protein
LLMIGYIKLFSMIFEQESVGYIGVILFAVIPLVLAVSVFVSNLIVPRKCRESVNAFIIGSIVPFIILSIELIIYIDTCLEPPQRMFPLLYRI